MIRAANFFKLDSSESDTDEERNKSEVTVESMKEKKNDRENKDVFAGEDKELLSRERENLVEEALVKKKSEKENVNSEAGYGVKKSKKKNKEKRVYSEADDNDGGKKSKKKKHKKESGGDEIGNSERFEGSDDGVAKRQTRKRKRDDCDLGAEENATDKSNKKKKKKPSVDSELEENSFTFAANGAKKKSKVKKQGQDPEVEENNNNGCTRDANQIQSENPEAKGNDLKDPKKKQNEDPEAEENNKDSAKDADKNQSENSEAEGNDLNSTENAKKKRKKKKEQSEDPKAEENNKYGSKDGTKKRKKKKQENNKSDEDVTTTPSSKSAKKVKFSDQVEFFPTYDEESEEEEEVEQVRGKRFTKEEDELIKKAVLEYVENNALGDEGVNMVMDCSSHKQVRGCWKEIAAALPWRPYESVYDRAHTLFEEGSKGVWSKEDLELVIEYQKKHGNDWKTLADVMGKHRKHVKDAWRRIRLASKKKGHWSMEEYQNLFDLVNKDLRMKAFQEKHSKHGMLRDNIPWMAISDQLRTRDHAICCLKWYDQLTSPMVAKGIWANVDDYRLVDELTNLDAASADDVDWDDLLDNRDGDACRSRWNQMVHHIGLPGSKTFAEQVEIMSQRYCPDIAEDREDFDNRPFDPED